MTLLRSLTLVLDAMALVLGVAGVLGGAYQAIFERPLLKSVDRLRKKIPATPQDVRLEAMAGMLMSGAVVLLGLGVLISALLSGQPFDRLLVVVYPIAAIALFATVLSFMATAMVLQRKCQYTTSATVDRTA
jgi:uncharacterized membrane protein